MYSCPLKYQVSGTRHSLYSLYSALVTNTSFLDQPQSVRSGLSFLVIYLVTSWSIVSCAKSIVIVVPESSVVGSFSHVKRVTMPSFVRSSTNLLRMPLQTDDTLIVLDTANPDLEPIPNPPMRLSESRFVYVPKLAKTDTMPR